MELESCTVACLLAGTPRLERNQIPSPSGDPIRPSYDSLTSTRRPFFHDQLEAKRLLLFTTTTQPTPHHLVSHLHTYNPNHTPTHHVSIVRTPPIRRYGRLEATCRRRRRRCSPSCPSIRSAMVLDRRLGRAQRRGVEQEGRRVGICQGRGGEEVDGSGGKVEGARGGFFGLRTYTMPSVSHTGPPDVSCAGVNGVVELHVASSA